MSLLKLTSPADLLIVTFEKFKAPVPLMVCVAAVPVKFTVPVPGVKVPSFVKFPVTFKVEFAPKLNAAPPPINTCLELNVPLAGVYASFELEIHEPPSRKSIIKTSSALVGAADAREYTPLFRIYQLLARLPSVLVFPFHR